MFEAFLRVSWMLAEANWLYKLLVLSANQAEEKIKAEYDASLWLRFLVLTTLCSKSHEGWLILSGEEDKNVHEVIEELLRSTDDSEKKQKLLEMQESLKGQLGNGSWIALIRNNIGFHYQYKKFNFPPFLMDNGQIKSDFLLTTYIGDCLPMIPLGPLFDVIINLYDFKSTSQQTLKEEKKGRARKDDWYNKLEEILKKIRDIQKEYYNYLNEIFYLILEKLVQEDVLNITKDPITETIENPPAHNSQTVYFFMDPPTREQLEKYKEEIEQQEKK
ncbi:hypothetical protein EM20IM_01100 [Candidatus Methylacidiphilum infernorum]|uniref:Uncharacterized protein n=1 Tax=Candidatus Methylacidiphilum infernorum TaxID=511746 RepID=A0ABX7PVS1_9BACT|nr:hypothetical protein [Candidatus Methylacidiphilum infernorum]QSR86997.1 hypothetical protein EM20IM_01100 [Candidatus Methylacidiphilum infernorum]